MDVLGICEYYVSNDPLISSFAYHLKVQPSENIIYIPKQIEGFNYFTDHYNTSDIKPFRFDKPSPDDIAISKQNQAFNPPQKKVPEKKKGPVIVLPKNPPGKPKEPIVKAKVPKPDPSERIKKTKQMSSEVRQSTLLKIKKDRSKKEFHISLTGRQSSGKSTIVGNLLYLDGQVDAKTLDKYTREAEKNGKPSSQFAYIVDTNNEEKRLGSSMDVAICRIETEQYIVSLMDCPGDPSYFNSLICSISQTTASVIVLDGSKEGYHRLKKGKDTATKDHIVTAKVLGHQQIIILINKMDASGWNESLYLELKDMVMAIAKKSGFKEDKIFILPVSGFTGENLKETNTHSFYNGLSLIDIINQLEAPKYDYEKPFQLCIDNCYEDIQHQMVVTGIVDQGFVNKGDKLLVLPSNQIATVKDIRHHLDKVNYISAGNYAQIILSPLENLIYEGAILCNPENPVQIVKSFEAQAITFGLETPLIRGSRAVLYIQQNNCIARIKRFTQVKNKDGMVHKPRYLKGDETFVVNIETEGDICASIYSSNSTYGRFILRDGGSIICVGMITKIIPKDDISGTSTKLGSV